MNRYFFSAAFALGLLALLWVGAGFVGSSPVALLMTLVLAAVYGLGGWELAQFRAATAGLQTALAQVPQPMETPEHLQAWLAAVPPPLRHTVRLRIEGERAGLPGPALTPYLVGLLVMLGMLGTFSGLILTFKGTVFALEGSADLQAIRTALAAPIKGLGLAFGTSVAGVAASAMLGLMSALARRERAEAGRVLDACAATVFRPLSLVHLRHEAFKALQTQALALPRVVDSLNTLVDGLERRNQQLDDQLLARQSAFQQCAALAYRELAAQVGQAMQTHLAAAAQTAADSLQRTVQSAMSDMVKASAQAHQRQLDATRQQLAEVAGQFGATAQTVARGWEDAQQGHARTQQALLEGLSGTLNGFTAHFEQRSAALLDQVGQQMARMAERDHHALAERTALLARIDALLSGLAQATDGQRAAIATLVGDAQSVLAEAQQRFAIALDAQGAHAAQSAEQIGTSAVALAGVGEAFGQGMARFNATQDKLADGLAHLEATLQQSMARSDEQLAYYVAQAREVIDLSIAAQQALVEDLRRLRATPKVAA